MKTTRVKVNRLTLSLGSPADTRRAASEAAGRVAAHVERRSGARLPASATSELAGRIMRALAEKGRG